MPFHVQVAALTRRETILKLMDSTGLAVRFITSIVVALVVGSIYFNLDATASNAYNRGGVLFIALLFNSFQAFSQ